MQTRVRLLLLALCAIVGSTSVAAGTLTDVEVAKLHPFFREVLAENAGLQGGVLPKTAPAVYDAIVYTTSPGDVRAEGVHVNSHVENFVTVQVTAEQIERLARLGSVSFIDPGSVNYPHNDLSIPEIGASLLHAGFINGTPYTGQGAIVMVFDSGIDWKHRDFRDPNDSTKTRILAIWDQTLTAGAGESAPAGFSYGVEYTKAHIENEIDGTPAGFIRSRDVNGHGTHVAGTAAGNGRTYGGLYKGVAPGADIIVVKGGDFSFSESRMIDGLTYANTKATMAGKPISVNYSIGGQVGPHDGTRAYEQAMTSFASVAGRVVVVSAGNDGNLNMHIAADINNGATHNVIFTVPSYTPTSGTENDEFFMDIWFDGNPNVSATLTSPNGVAFTRQAGETGDGPNATDGTITLWNSTSSLNSHRNIQCWVHDKTTSTPAVGTWTLALTNNSGGTVSFNGWLTDRAVGSASVSVAGGNNEMTVGMPGTSQGAITVGSWVTKWGWPSYTGSNRVYSGTDRTGNTSSFTSIGPTRDMRMKPDLAAPGQGISSVLSAEADTLGEFNWIQPGQKHWLTQGTSMAAPHVTGAAALLLGSSPTLTAAQIKTLMGNTADADAFTGSVPNYSWGYGKLDILEAVARRANPSAIVNRTIIINDIVSSNGTLRLTGNAKMAVRFTPSVSGVLTGMQVNATTLNNRPIIGPGPLICEVYTNSGGVPGTKIGNTVLHPLQLMNAGILNYVSMVGANVSVTGGTDFFLMLTQTNPSDTLIVRTDQATGATRSLYHDGSSWGVVSANLRIRAIVTTATGINAVEPEPGVPLAFEVKQNYPNPFNPSTTIGFSIPERMRVSLRVFNLLGQEVATLVNDEYAQGSYTVQWQPLNLASGTYLYRVQAGGYSETKKLVYLK